MPTAKRLKGNSSRKASQAKTKDSGPARTAAPAEPDAEIPLEIDGEFAQVARDNWLRTTTVSSKKQKQVGSSSKVRVQPAVLKRDIWDVLERESFAYKSLQALEGLQTLERYVLLPCLGR